MAVRSTAWLARGNRRVRHRGISRNNAWLLLRISGLNLRRLLNLGLIVNEGSWALGYSTVRTLPTVKTTG